MKINYLLLFILFMFSTSLSSQSCLGPGWIIFETQASIDNFATDNPDCIELNNHVWIKGADITNLLGLSQLETINDELTIEDAPNLTNLDGLENLSRISDRLRIDNNVGLTNLDGLSGLIDFEDELTISDCPNLTSISGLSNLDTLSNDLEIINTGIVSLDVFSDVVFFNIDELNIRENPFLENLTGLEGLTFIWDLNISDNASLNSLQGLNNATTVEGNFRMLNNPSLTNFTGLENLVSIGFDCEIEGNSIVNFEGLASLTSIGGDFIVEGNSIVNFEGLNNLAFIDDEFYLEALPSLLNLNGLESLTESGLLHIANSDNIVSLDGLNSLENTGSIYLGDNDMLADMTALESLTEVDYIIIVDNPNLSICHYPFNLCQLYQGLTDLTVSGNGPGCFSEVEILSSCENDYANVAYPMFYDANANGLLDNNESFFPGGKIHMDPSNTILMGNPEDGGRILLDQGTYTFSFDPSLNPGWELTTSPDSYTFDVDNTAPDPATMYFGMQPTQAISATNAYLSANLVRCNEHVLFTPFAKNEGTTISSGTIWLEIDADILDVEFSDDPDTIIPPYSYGWHFEDLYPGYEAKRHILLQIPGPPDFPIGDYLTFNTLVNYSDSNGSNVTPPQHTEIEVQCSYDPNDKQVSPIYPENYSLMDEELIYTIRFQNTGNAVAYDVVIRDTLDSNLDPASFNFIASSHEEVLVTSLEDAQYLTFDFSNIFLPDSTTNFDESQGFLMYSIRPMTGLPEETEITNTAFIYFDLNPAVITNTTENVLLSSFDQDEDGFFIWNDCDDTDPTANPDGIEIANNGIDENCDGEDLMVGNEEIEKKRPQIYPNPTNGLLEIKLANLAVAKITLKDLTGQLILEKSLTESGVVDLTEVPSAVYILEVKNSFGIWTERIVKL